MEIEWGEVEKALYPIKSYEELFRQWREAFGHPFVRAAFNPGMVELAEYARQVLGAIRAGVTPRMRPC
jgi:hypothetical protein